MTYAAKDCGICVFIHAGSYPGPRIVKNMEIAHEIGYQVIYLGAIRSRSLERRENWNGISIYRLGILYPQSSIWCLVGIPFFSLNVFIWLIRNRPQVIHASDVDGMSGVVLYKLIGGKGKVLFNIHDNFALRYKVPRFLKNMLKRIEGWVGTFADVVLLPDKMRLDLLRPWVPKQVCIVPNTPPDPGYYPRKCDGKLRIFAPGWLTWTRGYSLLGKLARLREDVELVICGAGPESVESQIRSWPRTKFYGYLSQQESLKLGIECDIVFAYYDPAVEINRYASPNKLFDALALGRPILVNEEIEVAQFVKDKGVGFCLPYGDLYALSDLVDRLLSNPDELMEIGKRARNLYEAEYRWDIIKPRILDIMR